MCKYSGFSLPELLVTFIIIGIISALTIPSFKNLFNQTEQKILSEQLLRAIQFSKTAAITLGQSAILCQSENQITCGGSWQSGFIVIANTHILFSFHHQAHQGVLNWRAFPYFLDHLEFLPTGFPHFQNGTFWYCPNASHDPVWAIIMNQAGRARITYPDREGEILDDKGERLAC